MTASIIAQNQTVSPGNFFRYVAEQSALPYSFLASKAARIDSAYRMGEPIEMVIDELRMVHSLNVTYRAPKSARSLALRVVKVEG